jgi:hypothetical protein
MEFKLAEWLNHPIIRDVYARLPRGADPCEVLVETMRVMHELDDRFPGATTHEILRSRELPPLKREELRERLIAAGATERDAALVAPLDHEFAAESTMSTAELSDEYGLGEGVAQQIVSMRRAPSARELELAAIVDEHGLSKAIRVTGIKSTMLRRAVGRVRFAEAAAR